MSLENTADKAYALGIIAKEMNINFDQEISKEDMEALHALAEDSVSESPVSDKGKEFKALIEAEKANPDSNFNKGFSFHKDLNENKIAPLTVFFFELLGKYAKEIVAGDPTVQSKILDEAVAKMNELDFPVSYFASPFTTINSEAVKLKNAIDGQITHRELEIKSLAVGFKHPKYGTLSPHLASLKDLKTATEKLREWTGLTEEDFRGEE